VCLIGASGSGKSTLLRCLNLLERVDEGTIVIDGQAITNGQVDVNVLRQKIGIVFQAFNLFPHMTVTQNITLAPRKARGLSKDQADAAAHDLLKRIGLADKADEFPDRLSGGQQQRVAIARALVNRPRVLIADEPTGNLDPVTSWEIIKLLTRVQELGTTLVMATHNAEIVNALRRRVIHLDHGAVVRDEREGLYAA
jgi:polar amino acid transport system ATP-binding protein